MDLIYNLGISAYKLAARIASVRNHKAKLMLAGQSRTYKLLKQRIDPNKDYIWIHASSLGEFEQGRPLIEMIKQHQPDAHIVLSFFSPSGYEVRKSYSLADVVCYLPFDLPHNVKRFLKIVNPKMAIFVKYEFWGNYLMELRRRQVPTHIISAIFRPSQIFFRSWGGMFRKMLACYDTIYVQNEASRALLADINVTNVVVAGDTRFDRVSAIKQAARTFPIMDHFTDNELPTLIMGSSWPDDEEIVLDYFNRHNNFKLVIAPHEFDRERLLDLMGLIKRPVGLYSQTPPDKAGRLDCLIVDSFGLLSSLYRYGDMAYVGGGFGSGIHNINEAAVFAIPVMFGPNHEKFREANDLIACGGGFCVETAKDFEGYMDRFLDDKAFLKRSGTIASSHIESQLGATKTIYDDIFGKNKAEK